MARQIGNCIQDLLHQFESQRALHLQRAKEAWEDVCPEGCRAGTEVLSYRDEELTIGVESQPLYSELSNFQKPELEEALRNEGDLTELKELTFEVM